MMPLKDPEITPVYNKRGKFVNLAFKVPSGWAGEDLVRWKRTNEEKLDKLREEYGQRRRT